MTVGQNSQRVARQSWSIGPSALVALLAGTLLTGGLIGAVLTSQSARSVVGVPAAVQAPIATFDAVRFRAEERQGSAYPQATFDAIQFRAEERETPAR